MSQPHQVCGSLGLIRVPVSQEIPVQCQSEDLSSLQGFNITPCSEQGQLCCPAAPSGAYADLYPSLSLG